MKISRKLYILFFVVWMVLLAVGSLLPPTSFPSWVDLGGNRDKVAHFIAYFFTAFLFYVAFRDRFKQTDIYAMLFAFDYGLTLEFVQQFVPHRVFSFLDLAANLSGVLFFFVLYRILWGEL